MGIAIVVLWTLILIQIVGALKDKVVSPQNINEIFKDRIITRIYAFLLLYLFLILVVYSHVVIHNVRLEPLGKAVQVFVAVATFIFFVIFDAVIGGSVSARLKAIGWKQGINSIYQFFYGSNVLLTLATIYIATGSCIILAIVLPLLLFLVEDTMYYVFIFKLGFWKIIYRLTGEEYHLPSEAHFPDGIAGWPGWVGRLFNIDFEISMKWIWILNTIGVAVSTVYVWVF